MLSRTVRFVQHAGTLPRPFFSRFSWVDRRSHDTLSVSVSVLPVSNRMLSECSPPPPPPFSLSTSTRLRRPSYNLTVVRAIKREEAPVSPQAHGDVSTSKLEEGKHEDKDNAEVQAP